MRFPVFFSFLLFAFAAACSPAAPHAAATPTIAFQDCVLSSQGITAKAKARCGTLTVPEDRTNPSGRTITLRVAVVPALNRKPNADPLVLLAGGPGQAATEAFPILISVLDRVHQDRDLVMVDQRGTGRSNPLKCTLPDDPNGLLDEAAVNALIIACPAQLQADVRFYTTRAATLDLDQVRAALGYSRVNLYGGSYGTRAALDYLRVFPDRVRALILDSVVSPDFVLLLNAAQDGQAALDKVIARCASDAACHAAFPDPGAEFRGLLDRLTAHPAQVQMAHPVTGKPEKFALTSRMAASAVFALLYASETVSLLPLTIHQAYAEENYAPLMAQALEVDAGIYTGLFYAVSCAEEAPAITPQQAAERAQGSLFGDRTEDLRKICAQWPHGDVPADFRAPLASNVPTLLISGDADPITPPRYAAEVAKQLPNSLHLIAPGMGHGNLIRGCISDLAADFIANGSVQELDAACVKDIRPLPFFTRLTGPQP